MGEDALLCGQVGLAGSTQVGNRCILAGQVGSAGHLDIAEGAIVTAQSGIHQDIPAAGLWSGSPLMDNRTYRKAFSAYKRLPELQKKVRKLAGEIERKKENEL